MNEKEITSKRKIFKPKEERKNSIILTFKLV